MWQGLHDVRLPGPLGPGDAHGQLVFPCLGAGYSSQPLLFHDGSGVPSRLSGRRGSAAASNSSASVGGGSFSERSSGPLCFRYLPCLLKAAERILAAANALPEAQSKGCQRQERCSQTQAPRPPRITPALGGTV